jgi:hypothetical protein
MRVPTRSERLGQPWHALEQHVAAGEQGDEQALEHRVLADDHPLELIQRVLETRARVLDDLGPVLVHQRLVPDSDGAWLGADEPEPPPLPSWSGQSPRPPRPSLPLSGAVWSGVGVADWTGVLGVLGASVAAKAAGTPMAMAPPAAMRARYFFMAASLPPHSSDPHKQR